MFSLFNSIYLISYFSSLKIVFSIFRKLITILRVSFTNCSREFSNPRDVLDLRNDWEHRSERGCVRTSQWQTSVSGTGRERHPLREERQLRQKFAETVSAASLCRHHQQFSSSLQPRISDLSILRDSCHFQEHRSSTLLWRRRSRDGQSMQVGPIYR